MLYRNFMSRVVAATKTGFLSQPVSTRLLVRSINSQQWPKLQTLHYRNKLSVQAITKNPADDLGSFGLTTSSRNLSEYIIIYPAVSTVATALAGQLPTQITNLGPKPQHKVICRPQQVEKLHEAVMKQTSEEVAIVYVTGEPGVGKTQVARKYAEEYYSQWSLPLSKTALTLDMSEFPTSYRKLAETIVNSDVAHNQDLCKVAGEMKAVLRNRSSWLLIIDNYNSTDFEGIDRDSLEKHLLPLRQATGWGTGTVLVTTYDAGVIPQALSPVTIDPLSLKESSELVGLLAGSVKATKDEENDKLTEREEALLMKAIFKNGWRCVPTTMVHIGDYIRQIRDQGDNMSYGLEEYLTELKKEEATDPEEANQKYVELAIKRMVKTSDALKKVFFLLAICPPKGIPEVVLKRLMKKYHKKEWAHKMIEIKKCTVVGRQKHHLQYIQSHRLYLRTMQNVLNTGMESKSLKWTLAPPKICRLQFRLGRTLHLHTAYLPEDELLGKFIDCFIEEADETKDTQKIKHLYQLLEEFATKETSRMTTGLTRKVIYALNSLRQKLP